jgi:hypothetical protein
MNRIPRKLTVAAIIAAVLAAAVKAQAAEENPYPASDEKLAAAEPAV